MSPSKLKESPPHNLRRKVQVRRGIQDCGRGVKGKAQRGVGVDEEGGDGEWIGDDGRFWLGVRSHCGDVTMMEGSGGGDGRSIEARAIGQDANHQWYSNGCCLLVVRGRSAVALGLELGRDGLGMVNHTDATEAMGRNHMGFGMADSHS